MSDSQNFMPKRKATHPSDAMQPDLLLHCQQEKAELARQLQQTQQHLNEATIQMQQLQLEHHNAVNRLNQKLEQARREYFDLELLLRTTTEHADALEDALSHKVDLINSEKSDLEIILETITEHADLMTGELLHKTEAQPQLKQDFLNEIKILRRRVEELKRQDRKSVV